MSTSVSTIRQFAEAAGLRLQQLIPLRHFRLAAIVRLPMGYFFTFKRKGLMDPTKEIQDSISPVERM
jgi:hypothetical protein